MTTPLTMHDADRYKLLGTYRTPRVRVVLSCEARDCDVIVTGYSDARIPWPLGRQRGRSARALVVYGGLAEAVRRESNVAVCHWFGITPQTVSKWRKALGVEPANPGTHRLKIAAARRGKPRPDMDWATSPAPSR